MAALEAANVKEGVEELKENYVSKSKDFMCELVAPVIAQMDAAIGLSQPLESLDLTGSSKDLFNSRIQFMQLFALSEALAEYHIIAAIDLSFNFIDDNGAGSLASFLQRNKSLKYLNLAGNNIGPEGAGKLAEAIQMRDSSGEGGLQVLNLNGNAIKDEGVLSIAGALRDNKSLKVLELGSTDMEEKGLIGIAVAMWENRTLEVINLENPLIHYRCQGDTAMQLGRMLGNNTCLREVLLGKHGLVDDQLQTLVDYGLGRNRTLPICTLDLRCNKLSPVAGPAFKQLLQFTSTLQMLNVSFNRLGDDGLMALAEALPRCHTLVHLDIRSNGSGELGLCAMAHAMQLKPNLTTILVWGNHFGPAACVAFLETLERAEQEQSQIVIDIEPYIVDGITQVAKVDIYE
mmetsp:Transcript_11464/g.32528  ORF Transcript_11464/g.32528 Transcript_11464/m.32528 type:complete len:403 (+) Transcript_11464:61-1269(+)